MALPEIQASHWFMSVKTMDGRQGFFEHQDIPEGEEQKYLLRLNSFDKEIGNDWRVSSSTIPGYVNRIIFKTGREHAYALNLGGRIGVRDGVPTERYLNLNQSTFAKSLDIPKEHEIEIPFDTHLLPDVMVTQDGRTFFRATDKNDVDNLALSLDLPISY